MGIVRSGLHKRKVTGAKRTPYRTKRKYEIGRPPANTKLGETRMRLVRVRGGNIKKKLIRQNKGNFAWGSEAIAKKTRILDVIYNASSNELVRTKTLVKSAVIVVDCTPFRQYYETRYGINLGRSKTVDESKWDKEKAEQVKKARAGMQPLDTLIADQFKGGKLMAKISSSPGQVGRVDGYILEG